MHEQPPAAEWVRKRQSTFHLDAIEEVASAVERHPIVVVGMSVNPHVKRARRILDQGGWAHHDLDFGGYHSQWRRRLAIKLWARWPTFPMVFVNGTLVGGADDLQRMVAKGALDAWVSRSGSGVG